MDCVHYEEFLGRGELGYLNPPPSCIPVGLNARDNDRAAIKAGRDPPRNLIVGLGTQPGYQCYVLTRKENIRLAHRGPLRRAA